MGEPTGFLQWQRVSPPRRAVEVRLKDWKEVYDPFPRDALVTQAGRCMDCGITANWTVQLPGVSAASLDGR